MSSFLFLFRGGIDSGEHQLSPQELQQHMEKWMAWFDRLGASGAFAGQGNPLARQGKAVRGRDRLVTDGPYGEAKDVIGGYAVVEARDLDAAVELARGCPTYELGGAVEVRPITNVG